MATARRWYERTAHVCSNRTCLLTDLQHAIWYRQITGWAFFQSAQCVSPVEHAIHAKTEEAIPAEDQKQRRMKSLYVQEPMCGSEVRAKGEGLSVYSKLRINTNCEHRRYTVKHQAVVRSRMFI